MDINNFLYPIDMLISKNFPTKSDFSVEQIDENKGKGVRCLKDFQRGGLIACFTGEILAEVTQHTIQLDSHRHLLDLSFVGYLLHSCSPNALLDTSRFIIWALADIKAGELLTIDYAVTEDALFKQFPCGCGAPNCRKWISGRAEPVNQMGLEYLAQCK